MLWKIIFLIVGLSKASMIQPYLIHSDRPFNQCADRFHQCNLDLDSPCCEENITCTLIHWNNQYMYGCLKTMQLDEPCQSNSDCSDVESIVCSPEEKVCKCSKNYLRVNGHRCAPPLGNPCMENSECEISNSICNKNKCVCKLSYQPQSNHFCSPTALRKPCLSDNDCFDTDNTVCSESGTCACTGGYQEINNAICASYLGGYCRHYDDCMPSNSACINNRCECQFGFIPTSHKECQPSPLGKACYDDTDCNQISAGSNQTEIEYICDEQKSFRHDLRCASLLGNFCRQQRHCLIENSHCMSNTCTCKDGFIPKSNRKCTPALLNNPCRHNNDCKGASHLICSNDKKCVCKEGYVAVNGSACAPTLGQLCSNTYPCATKNSECFKNMCHCKMNYWPISATECVPF